MLSTNQKQPVQQITSLKQLYAQQIQTLIESIITSIVFEENIKQEKPSSQVNLAIQSQYKCGESEKMYSDCNITNCSPNSYSDKQIKVNSQKIIEEHSQFELNKKFQSYIEIFGQKTKYFGDFNQAKNIFIKIANSLELSLSRDAEKITTVKQLNKKVIKNIIGMCLPFSSQLAVYQLQDHTSSRSNSIKLIQVSGKHQHFFIFSKRFIFQLWKNKLIEVKPQQLADTICLIHSDQIKSDIENCEKAFNQMAIKKLGSTEQIQIWHEQFMFNVKNIQNKLRKVIPQDQDDISRQQIYFCLQKSVFSFLSVYDFYEKIIHESNKDFEIKRREIVSNLTLKQVFEELEIQISPLMLQYMQQDTIISRNKENPYQNSISKLKQISKKLSPLENLKIIREFDYQMTNSYFKYTQSENQGSAQIFDMDKQLPITIYCVLLLDNKNIQTVITTLCDYYQHEDNFGTENRIITAINAAFDFIKNQWHLSNKNVAL